MLKNLPEQDLIALHAFFYFVNMKSKEQFFIKGTCNKKACTFTALLSIDSFGRIFENQIDKGIVNFTLTFSFKKHRALFKDSENTSSQSRLDYSILTQITPQLYTQALALNASQLSINDNCRATMLSLVKDNTIEVFSIYQKIMLPIVVKSNVVKIH
jgi:hypothetical protein